MLEKKIKKDFIYHIHNYTEYNHSEMYSLHLAAPGEQLGALLKGLTSVVDISCQSRDSNPQPRVTGPTLYPLGH